MAVGAADASDLAASFFARRSWSCFIPALLLFWPGCISMATAREPPLLLLHSAWNPLRVAGRCHRSYLESISTPIKANGTTWFLRRGKQVRDFGGKDTFQLGRWGRGGDGRKSDAGRASEWEVGIFFGYLADGLDAVSQPWIGWISGGRPGWKNKGESAALPHRRSFNHPPPPSPSPVSGSVLLSGPLPPFSTSQPIFCCWSLKSPRGPRHCFRLQIPGNPIKKSTTNVIKLHN